MAKFLGAHCFAMSQGLKSHVVFEALGMKGLLTYVGLYVAHKGLVNCQSLFVELNINFFSLILSCGFTFQKLACYAFSDFSISVQFWHDYEFLCPSLV